MSFPSSLIELKAELFKKGEEAQKLKQDRKVNLKGGGYKWRYLAEKLDYRQKIGRLVNKCENATGVEEKKAAEEELEKALRLSKQRLEEKANLYKQKMDKAMDGFFKDSDTESEKEEDECLVNFNEKALEKCKLVNKQKKLGIERRTEEKDEDLYQDDDDDDDDEWVEFTDSLGRSRKCLKKELKHYIEADKNHRRSPVPPLTVEDDPGEDDECNYPKRVKLSNNICDKPISPTSQGPIHYENVRFNEVRDHGVGFYQFSENDEERRRQMDTLNNLREQTIKQQEFKLKLKEKKSMALQQRLERIAARRGIKMPVNISSDDKLANKVDKESA